MELGPLRRRATFLIISGAGAVFLTRMFLLVNPGAGGSTILGFHVHHLLIGIVLVSIGGVPAVLLPSESSLKSVAICVFGAGLGLALDEWVLFVLRESAPNTPYMSMLSVAGALFCVILMCGYTTLVYWFLSREAGSKPEHEKTEQ